MICFNCYHEKVNVIKVYRNRRIKEGKWVANDKVDTRLISCEKCGQRYLTETVIVYRVGYKNYKTHIENIKSGEQTVIDIDNNYF